MFTAILLGEQQNIAVPSATKLANLLALVPHFT
jgi:hypothetical protein